ncbi:MAG: hypothetical protein K9M11_04530 [Candidatus Pacebacteria bacterium]|nr:hypothetical protein [Candidatus Paceibacterota bacterium]
MDPLKHQTKFQIRRPVQPETEEPHIGSFIKEEEPVVETTLESRLESEYEELDTEEKKDYTLSIAFTLIGALALISGFGIYVKKYVQPSKNSNISELFIDTTKSDEQARQDNLAQLKVSTDENASGTIRRSSSLDKDIFTQPNSGTSTSTTTNTNIITEYVIKATSTSNGTGTTTLRVQDLSEKVTSKELKITFLKDPFWTQTTTGENLILKQVGPEAKDTIFVSRFHGTSVTTNDEVNGNSTYFYNTNEKTWMRLEYFGDISSLGDKIIPQTVVPTRSTKNNKPIFDGTSRSKTLIIALSIDDFIIINISGTGYTKILDTFVNNISAI